jgi:hypothetical protein
MHLALDIRFNGPWTPRSIVAFYSFTYRLYRRFDAVALLGRTERHISPAFWVAFFRGPEPPGSAAAEPRELRMGASPPFRYLPPGSVAAVEPPREQG